MKILIAYDYRYYRDHYRYYRDQERATKLHMKRNKLTDYTELPAIMQKTVANWSTMYLITTSD